MATTEISDRQIETLAAEARRAGDLLQVAICRIALGEDAPGEVDEEQADARGWTDYTGSGMARWELDRIRSIRSAEDPVEYARQECESAIARASR